MAKIILSDVHLTECEGVKAKLVVKFFQQQAACFDEIYILGDLFDVWPGTSHYLVKRFQPLVETLGELSRQGHKICYVEGNHDFRLGKFFTEELGISVYPDILVDEWDGRKILLAHGDLADRSDYFYRSLRYFLRQDFLHHVIKYVPSQLVYRVGFHASNLSRRYSINNERHALHVKEMYRKVAMHMFDDGYDVVLMGHTHIPDDFSTMLGNRSCRYINVGDWVKNFTYLEYDKGIFRTKVHPIRDAASH